MMTDQSSTRIRFFSRIFPCGREMRERRQPLLGQDRRSPELGRASTAALGSTSQSFGGAAKARAQEPWEMCEYRSVDTGEGGTRANGRVGAGTGQSDFLAWWCTHRALGIARENGT